jgi:hypothetical protein
MLSQEKTHEKSFIFDIKGKSFEKKIAIKISAQKAYRYLPPFWSV